jgi:cytochrome c peroxidase
MHDGSLPDLRAVLRHYNRGGEAHPQKYPRIRPLGLTETELSDIIAFLESLTDEQLLNNPDLRPE